MTQIEQVGARPRHGRLCMIGPARVAYSVLMLGRPVDRELLASTMDKVILPAAGLRAA